ncbi:MAG TPA: hypothetical protein VJ063_17425 [Verrucomicrobiae bacterium]|nr:hypothetical protein [Verrucomicrobiae bacterium]
MKTRDEPLLPGEELVAQGLADLARGQISDAALLVLIAGPRLRRLGIAVPERSSEKPFEHLLYERIEGRMGPAAHSYYNGLIRRMTSYARILEPEHP